ncbi:MAG TPA: aspartyl protease family protein [Azospirillaceae bacterium]|nr:aspartyl protease family protein [Azospirillaceae bacterium]
MRGMAAAVLLASVIGAAGGAAAQCKLGKVATLPVLMDGNRPLAEGTINGQKVRVLIDSGAVHSMIYRSAANRLGLDAVTLDGAVLHGVGGKSRVETTVVDDISVGSFKGKEVRLLVAGEHEPSSGQAMILGQDLLQRFEVEYDLANGTVNFMKAIDCGDTPLIYWADTYSLAEIQPSRGRVKHVEVDVLVNQAKVRAILDTGAYTSVLSQRAAARAGVTPETQGVQAEGLAGGIGRHRIDTWVGTFASFTVGDETIRNAKLRFADLFRHNKQVELGSRMAREFEGLPEMLLGADFFRSHRILVSHSQGKIYFTHNGGPVFQVIGPMLEEGPEEAEGAE